MIIDAIIPAHNEAPRIQAVVRAVLASGAVRRTLVVDDGSTDGTALVAERAGAEVLRLSPNRGKGQAMKAAVDSCPSADAILFVDADLKDFGPEHVRLLCSVARQGYGMVCGLRDYGAMRNLLQWATPIITGERVVRRDVLAQVPWDCWNGYSIEVAINHTAGKLGSTVCLVPLTGVNIYDKHAKFGWWKGTAQFVKMFAQVHSAKVCLARNGSCTA